MIRIACPSCKSVVQAGDEKAGQTMACPRCRKAMTVPRPVARPAALPVATPVKAHRPMATAPFPVATPLPVSAPVAAPPASFEQKRIVILLGAAAVAVVLLGIFGIIQAFSGGSKKPVTIHASREEPTDPTPKDDPTPPSTPSLRNADELIEALKSKQSDTRLLAAKEMNKLTKIDRRAVGPLADLLKDQTDTTAALEMRKIAARCLAKLGSDAQPAIPQLTAALADPNKEVQLLSLDALGKMGQPGIGPVTDALRNKDAAVQAKAAAILGGYGKDAAPALSEMMTIIQNSDNDRRILFASQVVKIDPANKEIIKYLVAALSDSNDNNRRLACVALGIMGPNAEEAKVDVYETYEKESNTQVKEAAEDAYRKITGQ